MKPTMRHHTGGFRRLGGGRWGTWGVLAAALSLWPTAGMLAANPDADAKPTTPKRSAATPSAKGGTEKPGALTTLTSLLDQHVSKADVEAYKRLEQGLSDSSLGDSLKPLQGRQAVLLSPQDALARSLRKNLRLRAGQRDQALAEQAVAQAEAVFDPVFVLSGGYKSENTYTRRRVGPVYKKKLETMAPTYYYDIPFVQLSSDPDPKIVRLGYLHRANARTDVEEYKVSTARTGGPLETISGNLNIRQQLPWGPQVSLSKSVNFRQDHYDAGHSYDAPWAASLAVNLWVPLPRTKGFGELAPADVALKQQKLSQTRSGESVQALVNTILTQTDQAYWNLVQRQQSLLSEIEHRQTTQQKYDITARLFANERVTRYGMAQMEAELARSKILVESALEALITASNALAALVEDDHASLREALILPTGYHERLESVVKVNDAAAGTTALARRPELKMSAVDLESAALNTAYMQNQALPDLSFTGGYSQSVDNSVYGYKSYDMALSHMLRHPDQRSANVALNYNRPWGNRAAEAGVEGAKLSEQGARLGKESLENSIALEVSKALGDVKVANARVQTAKSTERLANMALGKADVQRDLKGDVSELEMSLKLRELRDARRARIEAMVDRKRAETRLLAAQGTVAEALAVETAINDYDKARIQALAPVAEFFSAPSPEAAAAAQQDPPVREEFPDPAASTQPS
ncbi:MAG: TolC family protein [Magnetococcales bacterium]|nr:TolC family protein [Magnetococcales bacterium]